MRLFLAHHLLRNLLRNFMALHWPSIKMDPILRGARTNLELGVALEDQNVNSRELADIAMLLELLADLGANGGYGHVQRVHGLDLGGLYA